jgi:hypothetical protein
VSAMLPSGDRSSTVCWEEAPWKGAFYLCGRLRIFLNETARLVNVAASILQTFIEC